MIIQTLGDRSLKVLLLLFEILSSSQAGPESSSASEPPACRCQCAVFLTVDSADRPMCAHPVPLMRSLLLNRVLVTDSPAWCLWGQRRRAWKESI